MRLPNPIHALVRRRKHKHHTTLAVAHALSRTSLRLSAKAVWGGGALLGVMLIGTLGFHAISGPEHSWLDAVYMTFIIVSTIGFGEIIDLSHSPGGRVFAMAIGVAGLATIWFLFSTLTVFLLEVDLNAALRRKRMQRTIGNMSNHYIVCGFGRVGQNVAAELEMTGRAFAAIDQDLHTLEERKERDDTLLYLHGDASDDDVLVAAQLERAKGIFAVTGDDSLNLMITVTARQINPRIRIVARCHEPRNIAKLKKAGANEVVSPDFTGGVRIVAAMIRPHVVSFLDEMLRSEHRLRVEEVKVPEQFEPRPLERLRTRSPHYVLLAIRGQNDWLFNPQDDAVLMPEDTLIAMCTPSGRRELEDLLLQQPPLS
ncbi:potassium channel protein [Niveibacterium umoris]|uniref:Voltage-gated potassium channel n=1 Tax=Niveibacterium umoris TaxID=1193620 RepID=A0A840BHW4_9RHOO|nr:NAD-binding protein [Niveibacterium umoris]MBB4011228.1 voltage-gated potassium channel [Niveibacterium umoris]